MITIIFAPPRTGKTCFMTHCLIEAMFNRERNKNMRKEILSKQQNGFNNLKTIPTHCVSANYDITGRQFRHSARLSRRINPYRLGFRNPHVKTHFNVPYECIGITEAQKYLNSRMSMYFPDWQSRWYEQHGHDNLDIFLDTQRPMLIDINIRELSQFVEIINMTVLKNKNDKIIGITWKIRIIENSSLFDRYMASGKQDSECYKEVEVKADYNVFNCYDHQGCKPKFYDGHMDEDFDYQTSTPTEDTMEGYINYLKGNDDELPENYYQRRKLV